MKNEELYRKTVDILYTAYFNDTLQHHNCYACAIGNLVAANNGYLFEPCIDRKENIVWDVCNGLYCQIKVHTWYSRGVEGNNQIRSTGYDVKNAWLIENAFEGADKGCNTEDYMFNGLEAVLKVLKQIHEVENDDTGVAKFKSQYLFKTLTH